MAKWTTPKVIPVKRGDRRGFQVKWWFMWLDGLPPYGMWWTPIPVSGAYVFATEAEAWDAIRKTDNGDWPTNEKWERV